MKRFGLLLASLASFASVPSLVQAQAFTANLEVRIDNKVRKNEATIYIGKEQCGDETPDGGGSQFTFRLTGYTSPINNLEMWVTGSDGTDCSTAASRTFSATSTRSCWLVKSEEGVNERITFTVSGEDIFRQNGGMDSSGVTNAASCPRSSNNKYTVFFVPLANSTSSNPSAPPPPLTGVGPQLQKAVFTLLTADPSAPGNARGGDGYNVFTLKWDKASGALNTTTYRAYFDTNVGADCSGSYLRAGASTSGMNERADGGAEADASNTTDADVDAEAGEGIESGVLETDAAADQADAQATDAGVPQEEPEETNGRAVKLSEIPGVYSFNTKTQREASLGDLDARGIALGEFVAAAVVSVDISGNESALSDVVCFERVLIDDFPTACEADPKCRDGFHTCSLRAPGLGRRAGIALTLLFGIGVALRVRRRRHV